MQIATDILNLSIASIILLGNELRERMGQEQFELFVGLLVKQSEDRKTMVRCTVKPLHNTDGMQGKINLIKAVRQATDMSLKEAKDTVETYGGFSLDLPEKNWWTFLDECVAQGAIVTKAYNYQA